MRTFLFFLFINCMFFSCIKRETIITNDHYNETIADNEPPPYSGVTTVRIQNYINRIYIDLLGREPTSNEMESATNQLRENELSDNAKNLLFDLLMGTQEYYNQFFEKYSRAYLGGTDGNAITVFLQEINLIIEYAIMENNDPLLQAYLIEQEKMEALQDLAFDYSTGDIAINEFMQIMVFNLIYDEVNMGAENFVISCFENLLKRLPTEVELANGVTMVDGFSAQLLQKEGHSKMGFLQIVTETDEFYQGLVVDIYRQLLAREPDSVEMGKGVMEFKSGASYQEVQKAVMRTAEYLE